MFVEDSRDLSGEVKGHWEGRNILDCELLLDEFIGKDISEGHKSVLETDNLDLWTDSCSLEVD